MAQREQQKQVLKWGLVSYTVDSWQTRRVTFAN